MLNMLTFARELDALASDNEIVGFANNEQCCPIAAHLWRQTGQLWYVNGKNAQCQSLSITFALDPIAAQFVKLIDASYPSCHPDDHQQVTARKAKRILRRVCTNMNCSI